MNAHHEVGAASVDTSGRMVLGPLLPERIGQTAHDLIGAAVARELHAPTPKQLLELWHTLGLGRFEPTYQLVERQIAVNRAVCYFHYHPRPNSWQLLGNEYSLTSDGGDGPVRVDRAWKLDDGRVALEEVKTGRVTVLTLFLLAAQLDRYRDAATATLGEAFTGIRVCILAAPRRSFWMSPDGTCRRLSEGC